MSADDDQGAFRDFTDTLPEVTDLDLHNRTALDRALFAFLVDADIENPRRAQIHQRRLGLDPVELVLCSTREDRQRVQRRRVWRRVRVLEIDEVLDGRRTPG